MFANISALETLIRTDANASEAEKEAMLSILRHGVAASDREVEKRVVGILDAARMLGKDRRYVYHLLNTGVLEGFYSGSKRQRATGVTVESIERATRVKKDVSSTVSTSSVSWPRLSASRSLGNPRLRVCKGR